MQTKPNHLKVFVLPYLAAIIPAACGSGSSGTTTDTTMIKKDCTSTTVPDTSGMMTDTANRTMDSTRK